MFFTDARNYISFVFEIIQLKLFEKILTKVTKVAKVNRRYTVDCVIFLNVNLIVYKRLDNKKN